MKIQSLFLVITLVSPVYGKDREPAATRAQEETLRQELRAMFKEDQAARIGVMKSLKDHGIPIGSLDEKAMLKPKVMWIMFIEGSKSLQTDQKNQKRLKEILENYGWPGKTLVGEDGANAAWLVAQHADNDVAFQKKCLALMEAAPAGEVSKKDIAYLTDRVLVAEGKKQRYGTQMGPLFKLRPIEEEDSVDERRATIGLPPIAEYVSQAKKHYEEFSQHE